MFTISDSAFRPGGCSWSRRQFLEVGALGAGSMSLPGLLAAKQGVPDFHRDKAVVLLFLQGGLPQVETFDPKMDAASDVRSCTGEVKTTIPGATFGGTFPRLAKMSDKLATRR